MTAAASRNGFTVREARADEVDRIGELTVTAYRAIPDRPALPDYDEHLRVAAGTDDGVSLVAVNETGAIVGSLTLDHITRPGHHEGWVTFRYFAVHPASQQRGVGERLIQEVQRRAELAGAPGIVLLTADYMTSARALYERTGFTRSPDHDDPQADDGGPVLRCYTLER